jgi:glycosyltransferase involved in cell wall biosynthesis
MIAGKRVLVFMPAYNAGETLEQTYGDIPFDVVDGVVLVDDKSEDNSLEV